MSEKCHSRAERDRNRKPATEPASQAMNTEKTNGDSMPPAIIYRSQWRIITVEMLADGARR